MPRAQTKRSARRVEVKDWRARALQMHTECIPMREIAKRVGKALSTVHEGIEAELAEITRPHAAALAERREREREDDLARLAIVIRGSIKKAAHGDAEASHVVIAALRQRGKLLGLEAPTKTEHSGPNGGAIMFDLTKLTDEQLDRAIAGDAGVFDEVSSRAVTGRDPNAASAPGGGEGGETKA